MDIAICGPGHAGVLPPNVERIDAPTPTVFVIGRLAVDGPWLRAPAAPFYLLMRL